MSEYTKPLVTAAVGALIVLFGFTPDFGSAKDCAGQEMQPGDSCNGSHGSYGYDDIAAQDAENRRNKQMILSVIGGAVVLGGLGFAGRVMVDDASDAARRRRADAERRARMAQDTWDRPAEPGGLEDGCDALLGDGRVDFYTHALCYRSGPQYEQWVRWDQITRVYVDPGHHDFTVSIKAEGNEGLMAITGFSGGQEYASKISKIADRAAKPKVYDALNNTGKFRLSAGDPGGFGLASAEALLGGPRELNLTAGGFVRTEQGATRTIPWTQITRIAMGKDFLGLPEAVITLRNGLQVRFEAQATTDRAAVQIARALWKAAR
ncbi:hypothetical protein [Streptomyces sp. NPDC054863]